MSTAIANGANEAERKAAKDANEVQDGCNLIAIVGGFHRHLIAMRDSGVCGDCLNNHPVTLAFISKFVALCRLTNGREIAALIAVDRIENGEKSNTKSSRSDERTSLVECGQSQQLDSRRNENGFDTFSSARADRDRDHRT